MKLKNEIVDYMRKSSFLLEKFDRKKDIPKPNTSSAVLKKYKKLSDTQRGPQGKLSFELVRFIEPLTKIGVDDKKLQYYVKLFISGKDTDIDTWLNDMWENYPSTSAANKFAPHIRYLNDARSVFTHYVYRS